MRKLCDIFRVTWQGNEGKNLLYSFVPRRGIRFQEVIKWVKPEAKPIYHPSRSGDLAQFPAPKLNTPYPPFKNSEELESADEKVKKIFSLGYQKSIHRFLAYQEELVDKVKRHAYDTKSEEVKIAKQTARIRYYESFVGKRPSKYFKQIEQCKLLIEKRKRQLKLLRLKDYRRFEWVLEQLDLEFRPYVLTSDNRVTRKKSVTLLANIKVERLKEERLAKLKQAYDEQKIPFLEKKIIKLKEIKEKEEKNNLPTTVTEADIQECIDKLEKVKIEVAERQKQGYRRKIHPILLEPYDEDLLWKKEKAGEKLRAEQELKKENKTTEKVIPENSS